MLPYKHMLDNPQTAHNLHLGPLLAALHPFHEELEYHICIRLAEQLNGREQNVLIF